MFEKSVVQVQNRQGFFHRQSSRQLSHRSHQLALGRWHIKSVLITAGLLLIVFYYVYKAETHPGTKTKKRDLVIRPSKPYKSPYSRRRHAKQQKDEKNGLPVKIGEHKDKNMNKMNITSVHQIPKPAVARAASTKASQHKEKSSNVLNRTVHQNASTSLNFITGKLHRVVTPKPTVKSGVTNSSFIGAERPPKAVPGSRISGRSVAKNPLSKDGVVHFKADTAIHTKTMQSGNKPVIGEAKHVKLPVANMFSPKTTTPPPPPPPK